MNKFKWTYLLLGLLIMGISSCLYTEMGDPGPQGPPGERGPGRKGVKGKSFPADTVLYSEWKTYSFTNFGSRDYRSEISIPELTEDRLDSLVVMVYFKNNATTSAYGYLYKLPYTSATGGGAFIYSTVKPGKIILHATYDVSDKERKFRYIILPLAPTLSLTRKSGDESQDNILDEYSGICNYYQIPQ